MVPGGADGGHIKTFPTITTVDQLCDAVTMAIHIASPFHTAVNYLQNFTTPSWWPAPPCLCAPMPTTLAELQAYKEAELVRTPADRAAAAVAARGRCRGC